MGKPTTMMEQWERGDISTRDLFREIDRLRAELAAKSKELRRIQIRATPHPDDNDDDRKRNLYHIESIAKAAMGEGNGR